MPSHHSKKPSSHHYTSGTSLQAGSSASQEGDKSMKRLPPPSKNTYPKWEGSEPALYQKKKAGNAASQPYFPGYAQIGESQFTPPQVDRPASSSQPYPSYQNTSLPSVAEMLGSLYHEQYSLQSAQPSSGQGGFSAPSTTGDVKGICLKCKSEEVAKLWAKAINGAKDKNLPIGTPIIETSFRVPLLSQHGIVTKGGKTGSTVVWKGSRKDSEIDAVWKTSFNLNFSTVSVYQHTGPTTMFNGDFPSQSHFQIIRGAILQFSTTSDQTVTQSDKAFTPDLIRRFRQDHYMSVHGRTVLRQSSTGLYSTGPIPCRMTGTLLPRGVSGVKVDGSVYLTLSLKPTPAELQATEGTVP
nr:uncharacterized protein CI109_006301 [Kwoniella shandongensis]KAA5525402.1 hypothetical protein CI109_006301 [Kwoniella shandongensis]